MKLRKVVITVIVIVLVLVVGSYYAVMLKEESQPENSDTISPVAHDSTEGASMVTVVDENGERITFDTSDWSTYTNDEFGFSLKYPSKYEIHIPAVNKDFPWNENTVFLFNVRHMGAIDDVGHAFEFSITDTKTGLGLREEYATRPSDFVFRDLKLSNGTTITVSRNLESLGSDHSSAYFEISDYVVEAASISYGFAEFQAILSTLQF